VREALDFAPSVVLLREARNVTYKSFVKPGNLLRLEVACRRLAPGESDFEAVAFCRQTETVKARFGLTHFCLASRDESLAAMDDRLVREARARFGLLTSLGKRTKAGTA